MTPEAVISEARSWVRVRFFHQGRDRDRGVDCVGLLIVVAQALELVPANFERNDYSRFPNREELLEKIQSHCRRVELPVAGGIIGFRWASNSPLAHTAIYTGSTIIHSSELNGGVVEHAFAGRWPRLAESFWLFPGVTYE